jgi:hypothetical protein
MSQQELVKRVIDVLSGAGIAYMLTGSVVSSMQGEPRATHDLDVVIALTADKASELLKAFSSPEYYLSAEAIKEAIAQHSSFNLLSLDTGEKVDFWMLTNEPFDQSRFSRRRYDHVLGIELNVSAPEDTILMKLRWAKLSGGSEKQFTDALRVYEVQHKALDFDYLKHWAVQLGVEDLWQRLQEEAKPEP